MAIVFYQQIEFGKNQTAKQLFIKCGKYYLKLALMQLTHSESLNN